MAQTQATITAALAAIDTTARKEAQRVFITNRIENTKMFNKYGLIHTESNMVIVTSLMGEMRNLVQQFFKGAGSGFTEKKCDACNTTDSSLQYDRAHDRGCSRIDVALAGLNRLRPDETVFVAQKDVLKAFIKEHAEVSLWYLCKPCHREYDRVP